MGKKGKAKHKGGRDPRTAADGAPIDRADERPVDSTNVATRLNGAAIHLLRRLHREDAALGQSSTRLSALSVLVFGGSRTLGQLAEAEGVTAPSMTRLVSAMEADGLVARSRSDQDGRLTIVSATPAGTDLLHRGRDQRVASLASLLDGLPEDDRRCLEQATGILEDLFRAARRS